MSTRREFLRVAGQGTLAAGLSSQLPHGAWVVADVAENASGGNAMKEEHAECDVLVIGGGVAGLFAAIKAREQGASVLLVNKGNTGRSGFTPFAEALSVFDPARGHKLAEWCRMTNHVSEYLNNRYWSESCYRESGRIFADMQAYGVPFKRDDKGQIAWHSEQTALVEEVAYGGPMGSMPIALRQHAEKIGVRMVDRVMLTEFLKQNGRIVGAVGISPEKHELHIFTAGAIVLCSGACGYKPVGYPPLHQLTGDGEAMAYRAGAELLGKEFIDTHVTRKDAPLGVPNMLQGMAQKDVPEHLMGLYHGASNAFYEANALGEKLPPRPKEASHYLRTYLAEEFEAAAQRAPVYKVSGESRAELVGGACLGMSIRKADGLWPADRECRSSVAGLFAAGDALGTMQNGAVYAVYGSSTLGSAVTGAIAGAAAAKEAKAHGVSLLDAAEVARARVFTLTPRQRQGGYSPRWVTQLLQNTMAPFFVYFIKKADRLQAALTQIEFMQQHIVPALIARDPHELRLAHETRSMVLSAEIRLRSALFRTESRGNHYREDFPRRDDQNWLAWTKVRNNGGTMELVKVSMPAEWTPDPAMPYETRYPVRFPGE